MEKILRAPFRLKFNLKGDLFASTFTFGGAAAIRLLSSLILTRLLTPTAYGMYAIVLSLVYVFELLSDLGPSALIIRHPRGDEVRFVHTIWTIRLIRAFINFSLLYLLAPLLASLYRTPALTHAFRTLSFIFLLTGAESMSFVLSQRRQKARIYYYTEFVLNTVMAISVIGMAYVLHNVYALIYGSLLQRALFAVSSHFLYREIGVGIAFDREAVREQFRFARAVTPSSILTIVLSQYDRLVFLRLFDAALLGVYSIAGNMLNPIKSIITNNARVILYARCAEYFRGNRETAAKRYYAENNRLMMLGILFPALMAGFAQSMVSVLYDPRYLLGGYALLVLGLGTVSWAFYYGSESLLVASGFNQAYLYGNAVRLVSLVPASIVGYYLGGFAGFIWLSAAASLAPLAYLYYEQHKRGLLNLRVEFSRMLIAAAAFLVSLGMSRLFLATVPATWLHLHFRHH